jgi:hypothetical protein
MSDASVHIWPSTVPVCARAHWRAPARSFACLILDIRDLQRRDLTDAQPGTVSKHEWKEIADKWTAKGLRAEGRYVRLLNTPPNFFHLAEVEIY